MDGTWQARFHRSTGCDRLRTLSATAAVDQQEGHRASESHPEEDAIHGHTDERATEARASIVQRSSPYCLLGRRLFLRQDQGDLVARLILNASA